MGWMRQTRRVEGLAGLLEAAQVSDGGAVADAELVDDVVHGDAARGGDHGAQAAHAYGG